MQRRTQVGTLAPAPSQEDINSSNTHRHRRHTHRRPPITVIKQTQRIMAVASRQHRQAIKQSQKVVPRHTLPIFMRGWESTRNRGVRPRRALSQQVGARLPTAKAPL